MEKLKNSKQIERHLKGIANHYRIDILLLVASQDKITLDDIVRRLDANQKTLSEHARRLCNAGLLNKKYRGRFVEHSLSPYGKTFVRFINSFRRIK